MVSQGPMDPSLLLVPTGTEVLGYASVRDNRTSKQRVIIVNRLHLMIGDRGMKVSDQILIGDIGGTIVRGKDGLEIQLPGRTLDLTWQHPFSHENGGIAGIIDDLLQDREGRYRNPRLQSSPPQQEQRHQQHQSDGTSTKRLAVPLVILTKPRYIPKEILWPQVPDPVELAFWDNYTNQICGYQPKVPCNVSKAAAYFHAYLETYNVKMKISFPGMKSVRFLCSQLFHDQVVHLTRMCNSTEGNNVSISTSSVVDIQMPYSDWESYVSSWNQSQNLQRSVYVSSVEYDRSKAAASSSSGAVPSTASDIPHMDNQLIPQYQPQSHFNQPQQRGGMPHHWTPPKQPRGVYGKI